LAGRLSPAAVIPFGKLGAGSERARSLRESKELAAISFQPSV